MAIRRLALLGAAEGPWIDVSRVRNAALRVQGMLQGNVEGFVKTKDGRNICIRLGDNGQLPFHDCEPIWIKLKASHPTRSLICEIVNARMVA